MHWRAMYFYSAFLALRLPTNYRMSTILLNHGRSNKKTWFRALADGVGNTSEESY